MTAQETADEQGYHVNYLYWLLEGRVKAEQFNGVRMISPQEVERMKSLQGPGVRRAEKNQEQ